jgi:hypothetical protein
MAEWNLRSGNGKKNANREIGVPRKYGAAHAEGSCRMRVPRRFFG